MQNQKERTRLLGYVSRSVDNPYSNYEFAQPHTPTLAERLRTARTERDVASYKTGDALKVVAPSAPSPSAAPNSWPPIPPSYVPRPGTLIHIPWETRDFAADQPSPQVMGTPVTISRSAKVQKGWNTNNPGQIFHYFSNTTTKNEHTTDKVGVSPYPDPPIVEKYDRRGY